MRNISPIFAAIAFCIAVPSNAQTTGKSEAAAEAAADAVSTIENVAEVATSDYEVSADYPQPAYLKSYNLIQPADYPIAAWQADETGRVGYTVEVSVEGKPISCTVTDGANLAILAAATCPLIMERADFTPAENEAGEPIASTYEGSHNWRKREPKLPQMALTFQYLHDENGVSKDCKFLRMENLPEDMLRDIERDKERGRLCPGPAGTQGIPYRGENGVPIARLVTFTVDVTVEEPGLAPSE